MIKSVKEYDNIVNLILNKIVTENEDWHKAPDGIDTKDYEDVIEYIFRNDMVVVTNKDATVRNAAGGLLISSNQPPRISRNGLVFLEMFTKNNRN